MNYMAWFSNVKPTLHSWDKPYLIMMYYYSFCLLLDLVCSFKGIKVILYLCPWGIIFCTFLTWSSSGLGIRVMLLHKISWLHPLGAPLKVLGVTWGRKRQKWLGSHSGQMVLDECEQLSSQVRVFVPTSIWWKAVAKMAFIFVCGSTPSYHPHQQDVVLH